jgi:hypothetical protein
MCGHCGKATDVGDWCSMQCFQNWQATLSLPLTKYDPTLNELRQSAGYLIKATGRFAHLAD